MSLRTKNYVSLDTSIPAVCHTCLSPRIRGAYSLHDNLQWKPDRDCELFFLLSSSSRGKTSRTPAYKNTQAEICPLKIKNKLRTITRLKLYQINLRSLCNLVHRTLEEC